MTRQPTAKMWEHVRGVTYPKTCLTEAQIDTIMTSKQREVWRKSKAKKRTSK